MKALRVVVVLAVVATLTLGSVGSAFAKGPQDGSPGKSLQAQGKKQGFFGNVTAVTEITDGDVNGNVTLMTRQAWTVKVMLTGETRYKVPRETRGWDDLGRFREILGENLAALEGRRVAVSATNVEEISPEEFTGEALRLMVFPEPGERQHAHRTGVVTDFNFTAGIGGNITIVDIKGVPHEFTLVGNQTDYRPRGTGPEDIVVVEEDEYVSFVTVVVKGDPKVEVPVVKAVVLHRRIPEGWPVPTP